MSERDIKSFEDTEVWQMAKKLGLEVYRLSSQGEFGKDWALRDQLRRSAISIMANIAEGSERTTRKEFVLFLGYSLGSAAETKSHILFAQALGYVSLEEVNGLLATINSIARQIKGLRRSLNQSGPRP